MKIENNDQEPNYSSMSLQTLPNKKKPRVNHQQFNPSSLQTSDIEGARCRYLEKPIKQRQIFYNRNDDIDRSHSRCLIPKQVNKVDRQLEIDDISGTRTKVNQFTTTRRTDPLNPRYQLPQVILAEVPQPKFIKDSLNIDDIEGTRVKETFIRLIQRTGKIPTKQPMVHPQKLKRPTPKTNNFLLDVTDINQKDKEKQGKNRCTNPLDPVYLIPSVTNNQENDQLNKKVQSYGAIQGNKPTNPKAHINCPDFCLNVKDIPGTVSKIRKQLPSSKQVEINGTKPESLKRGISTNRKTNPLQPKYSYIGNSEMNNNTNYSRPKTAVQRFDTFFS